MYTGSFGAQGWLDEWTHADCVPRVLLFGAATSPFSQPYNIFVSHIIASLIGVFFADAVPRHTPSRTHGVKLPPDLQWLAAALAGSLSLVLMNVTRYRT